MTFADEVNAGLNAIYVIAGVATTFVDRDAVETRVTSIIEYDLNVYGDTVDISAYTALISVRKSELQYPPRRGEQYKVTGCDGTVTTYTVDSVLYEDDVEHRALVS